MDNTLKRILSLIPQKPDGKFVHGAVKEFATTLGLKSGNIVSDWIAGRSKSYEGYLYQISALHNVSVEWLRGETDDPTPVGQKETFPVVSDEERLDKELISRLCRLTPEEREKVDAFVQGLLASR